MTIDVLLPLDKQTRGTGQLQAGQTESVMEMGARGPELTAPSAARQVPCRHDSPQQL